MVVRVRNACWSCSENQEGRWGDEELKPFHGILHSVMKSLAGQDTGVIRAPLEGRSNSRTGSTPDVVY